MSFDVMQGLRDAMARCAADDVRVVVLTGAGDKAFCAGADLGGRRNRASAAAAHEGRGLLADLFRDMWALGKPIDRTRARLTRWPAGSASRARATSSSPPTTACSARRRSTSACGPT